MKRESPIAGTWYKGDHSNLSEQIEILFKDTKFGPGVLLSQISQSAHGERLIGVISPHAGYLYSGSIAAWSYKALKESYPVLDTCIILGPNHRGIGPSISIYPEGLWEFPNCSLTIDQEIIDFILRQLKNNKISEIHFETTAHSVEHSIDIQCPILGSLYGSKLKIIPICIRDQTLENANMLAELIYKIINAFPKKCIAVVASSDLSHEKDYPILERNDEVITNKILQGNPKDVNSTRISEKVTMCGYGPILTLLELTNKFGKPKLVKNKYANSNQVKPGGGYSVGYLSVSCFVT